MQHAQDVAVSVPVAAGSSPAGRAMGPEHALSSIDGPGAVELQDDVRWKRISGRSVCNTSAIMRAYDLGDLRDRDVDDPTVSCLLA